MPEYLTVSQEQFAATLQWLRVREYQSITASEYRGRLNDTKLFPPRLVLLTFDDAYSNLPDIALPLLKKYGFAATIFVVAGEIGGSSRWHQREGLPLMSAAALRAAAQAGFEIGSHSCSHPDLRESNDEALVAELGGSRSVLEELLQGPVTSFAYPYGAWDQRVRAAVALHYQVAFTCLPGLNSPATDPYLLARALVLPADRKLDLLFRLQLGWSPIDRTRQFVKRLLGQPPR